MVLAECIASLPLRAVSSAQALLDVCQYKIHAQKKRGHCEVCLGEHSEDQLMLCDACDHG